MKNKFNLKNSVVLKLPPMFGPLNFGSIGSMFRHNLAISYLACIVPGNRRFYSTSLPQHKLTINSNDERLIFIKGQSVLILPPLKPFKSLLESSKDGLLDKEKVPSLFLEFMDFHTSIFKVFDNLIAAGGPGFYQFELYFYIESINPDYIFEVYTYDFFDKKTLNLVYGQYGLTSFLITSEHLDEGKSRDTAVALCNLITTRLREVSNHKISNDIINFGCNRETLLVITKSTENVDLNKNSNNRVVKPNIPGITITGNKRFYSTSSPSRNRCFQTSANIHSKIVKHNLKKGGLSTILIPHSVFVNKDFDRFFDIISNSNLQRNTNYSLLMKVKKDQRFLMLSKRQYFLNNPDKTMVYKNNLLVLFNLIIDLIDIKLEDYYFELDGDVDLIVLDFFSLTLKEQYVPNNLIQVQNFIPKKSVSNIKS